MPENHFDERDRPDEGKSRRRITVNLPERFQEAVEDIAQANGTAVNDLIRRALSQFTPPQALHIESHRSHDVETQLRLAEAGTALRVEDLLLAQPLVRLFGPDDPAVQPSAVLVTPETSTNTLFLVTRSISVETLRVLAKDPTRLFELTPQQFEEVVAELLHRDGYSVQLTPRSGDAGVDVRALKRDSLGEFLYLVQCKRYVPPRKVGVEAVRDLYGVVQMERGNGGALVTTSYFTKPAHKAQRDVSHQLSLVDLRSMQRWLEQSTRTPTIADLHSVNCPPG